MPPIIESFCQCVIELSNIFFEIANFVLIVRIHLLLFETILPSLTNRRKEFVSFPCQSIASPESA